MEGFTDFDESANAVSSPTSSICVAVRVRPLSTRELAKGIISCCSITNGAGIAISRFGDPNGYLKSEQTCTSEYLVRAHTHSMSPSSCTERAREQAVAILLSSFFPQPLNASPFKMTKLYYQSFPLSSSVINTYIYTYLHTSSTALSTRILRRRRCTVRLPKRSFQNCSTDKTSQCLHTARQVVLMR